MPLGTSALLDTVADVSNGVTSMKTTAAVAAKYGGNIKTATAPFAVVYAGHLVQFAKGVPVHCDAGLLAVLAAMGAPVI